MIRHRQTHHGFTLLELLVAIAVFSIMAVMAYGTLSSVMMAKTQTREAAQQLTRIQQAIMYIERDILQMVNRPIRDANGDFQPALRGAEYGDYRLEFTRTGYPNPNNTARSYLQHITYAMPDNEEHKLYRYIWPALDGREIQEAHKLLLLEGVEELVLHFYDQEGNEHSSWPPPASQQAGGAHLTTLPRAIKISLKLKTMGEIWRTLEIPGA